MEAENTVQIPKDTDEIPKDTNEIALDSQKICDKCSKVDCRWLQEFDEYLTDMQYKDTKLGCSVYYWRILVSLWRFKIGKPFHPDGNEKLWIHSLRDKGFSHDQLGYIFDRSTQTIHEILKKTEIEIIREEMERSKREEEMATKDGN